MKIISTAITDKGMVRVRNEDSFFRDDQIKLYVVADGMGGHRGGDIASKLAVEEIERSVRTWKKEDVNELTSFNGQQRSEVEGKMLVAIRRANALIFSNSEANPELKGMGTTSTTAMVEDGEVTIGHVGDSRAYLIRGNQIRQVTEDHSWVNEQIKAGFITPQEARNHRLKNLITRSLGHEPSVKIDVLRLALNVGDKYFLCSDGMSNLVEDNEIRDTILANKPEEALNKLVETAKSRGGHDNITAVMFGVFPD